MTAREAIDYIEACGWSATRLGLGRTRELLHLLGDPQKKLRFVHVTGSNGKGSTCAMLEAILRAAGCRTGLYTSPYIQDFCERMQVDGVNIPGETLSRLTERVRVHADAMADHPSQFELVTAIAMLFFLEARCDIVVLEVGMGGALDSTNVIDAPEAAVLTNIGLEHTEYLGSTLEAIAETKAGIIKPGCRAVLYDGAPEVTAVVERVCKEKNVPLRRADFSRLEPLTETLDGQTFRARGRDYRLALLGEYQLHNAAVALETVEALREGGWAIPEEAVQRGLATVRWPARLEVMSRGPLCILDGGHNPQCAEALAASLRRLLPGRKAVFLIGVLADKDYPRMMELLTPLASEFTCLTPLSARALPAEALAEHLRARGAKAIAAADIPAGLRAALDAAGEDGAVVIFGSLYLVGAVRGAFDGVYRGWLRRKKRAARDALSAQERREKSEALCARLLASAEYRRAKTVLLYDALGGEAQLDALLRANSALPERERKEFAFPVCGEDGTLTAVVPGSLGKEGGAWRRGAFGIWEPISEQGTVLPPEALDLVICPCAAFDRGGGRLGMGGGYYDRFLPRCTRAAVVAAAFEVQRTERVPMGAHDVPVSRVFTEARVYTGIRVREENRTQGEER